MRRAGRRSGASFGTVDRRMAPFRCHPPVYCLTVCPFGNSALSPQQICPQTAPSKHSGVDLEKKGARGAREGAGRPPGGTRRRRSGGDPLGRSPAPPLAAWLPPSAQPGAAALARGATPPFAAAPPPGYDAEFSRGARLGGLAGREALPAPRRPPSGPLPRLIVRTSGRGRHGSPRCRRGEPSSGRIQPCGLGGGRPASGSTAPRARARRAMPPPSGPGSGSWSPGRGRPGAPTRSRRGAARTRRTGPGRH